MTRSIVLFTSPANSVLDQVAAQALKSATNVLPCDVLVTVKTVTGTFKTHKLPCLCFKVDDKTVYRLEGSITSEDIFNAVRRLL